MGRIIFEFDLQEDINEIKLYNSVHRLYFALDEIYNMARNELKYGEEELSDHIDQLLERIKDEASIVHELDE